MECEVPIENISKLHRILHCCKRVGEEVHFEFTDDELVLRTLNQARSAYFCIRLKRAFFENYDRTAPTLPKGNVLLKNLLPIFRTKAAMERITLKLMHDRLEFHVSCAHSVRKIFKLHFEECMPLQAPCDKTNLPGQIIAVPERLLNVLNNFHTGLCEVSLRTWANEVSFSSFEADDDVGIGLATEGGRLLFTKMMMDSSNFDSYRLGPDLQQGVGVAFALKEFKSMLTMCDNLGTAIELNLDIPGRPIIFSCKLVNEHGPIMTGDAVLSTCVSEEPPLQSGVTTQADPHPQPPQQAQAQQEPPPVFQLPPPASKPATTTTTATANQNSSTSTGFGPTSIRRHVSRVESENGDDDDDNENDDDGMLGYGDPAPPTQTFIRNKNKNTNANTNKHGRDGGDLGTPMDTSGTNGEGEGTMDDSFVEATPPPPKRARPDDAGGVGAGTVFNAVAYVRARSGMPTQHTGQDEYAPDADAEDDDSDEDNVPQSMVLGSLPGL